jgi:type VI protein secretion system component Hcp
MRIPKSLCATASIAAVGLLASAAHADVLFLSFGGTILGDSTDPQHLNELVLQSYTLGVTADTTWTKGGGASVGKPQPGDFKFIADVGRAVPPILKHIYSGLSVPNAVLTVRADGAPGKQAPPGFEYAKYSFTDVFFTSVGQAAAGEGRAATQVSFAYKTLKMQTFAPGNPTPVSCVQWDVSSGFVTPC